MRLHKVISAFLHGGKRIAPPDFWMPPSEDVAVKMTKAGCLRLATNAEIKAYEGPNHDSPSGAAEVSPLPRFAPTQSSSPRRNKRRKK